MLSVGLTGGIGTGKTTVGRMFVELGCHLIDADTIVHQLLQPGEAVYKAVVEAFGPGIVDEQGRIRRPVLGETVFNNSEARKTLNSLVHPAVIQREHEWLEGVKTRDPNAIAIVDAALMIEIGTYKDFEKLVVVVCSPEEQRRRLRERSGLSDEQIEARIKSQMPIEEKAKYADYVIDNSGSVADTKKQVQAVFGALADPSMRIEN